MATLTVVVGYCGSGKTTLLNSICLAENLAPFGCSVHAAARDD